MRLIADAKDGFIALKVSYFQNMKSEKINMIATSA